MASGIGSSHATRLAQIASANQQQQASDLQRQAATQQQQSLDAAASLQASQLANANQAAQVASQKQVAAIQQSVSVDTWNMLKQFGQRAAMTGAGLVAPLSSATGGFANAPATAAGTPARA